MSQTPSSNQKDKACANMNSSSSTSNLTLNSATNSAKHQTSPSSSFSSSSSSSNSLKSSTSSSSPSPSSSKQSNPEINPDILASYHSHRKTKISIALLILGCLVILFMVHISVGATKISLGKVWEALTQFNSKNFTHIIIWKLRFPRAIIALTVGAALAVAGALMQGVTRNPLAEPSVLGLMHGASFAAVIAISIFGIYDAGWLPLIAALGAFIAAMLVWGISVSARTGSTPLTLILSGSAVTSFLAALIALIKLADNDTFDTLRHWLVGSLSGRTLETYWFAAPWIAIGLVLAMGIARQVTTFAMGEETATGLGVNVTRLKVLTLTSVIMLTAASVALVGPLGFVGLVIPHVVRLFIGHDYSYIIPFSALVGAFYVLLVDIIARIVLSPVDITTGIVTAIFGAPLFVWLVRVKL